MTKRKGREFPKAGVGLGFVRVKGSGNCYTVLNYLTGLD